jgi:hypothetical protein
VVLARCGIACGLIALAACGSSLGKAPAGSAAASCGPAAAKTLAVDRTARVYESAGEVYGCATASRRSYRLGASARSIREGRAGPIALAGTDVAYGYTVYGVDTISAQVLVRDLTTGKQLRSEPATTAPARVEFVESVDSVVVKPDGAVAWIGESGSVTGGPTNTEVDRADARGLAKLDSGGSIDVHSLRLHGGTVTWRHSGNSRSASLE